MRFIFLTTLFVAGCQGANLRRSIQNSLAQSSTGCAQSGYTWDDMWSAYYTMVTGLINDDIGSVSNDAKNWGRCSGSQTLITGTAMLDLDMTSMEGTRQFFDSQPSWTAAPNFIPSDKSLSSHYGTYLGNIATPQDIANAPRDVIERLNAAGVKRNETSTAYGNLIRELASEFKAYRTGKDSPCCSVRCVEAYGQLTCPQEGGGRFQDCLGQGKCYADQEAWEQAMQYSDELQLSQNAFLQADAVYRQLFAQLNGADSFVTTASNQYRHAKTSIYPTEYIERPAPPQQLCNKDGTECITAPASSAPPAPCPNSTADCVVQSSSASASAIQSSENYYYTYTGVVPDGEGQYGDGSFEKAWMEQIDKATQKSQSWDKNEHCHHKSSVNFGLGVDYNNGMRFIGVSTHITHENENNNSKTLNMELSADVFSVDVSTLGDWLNPSVFEQEGNQYVPGSPFSCYMACGKTPTEECLKNNNGTACGNNAATATAPFGHGFISGYYTRAWFAKNFVLKITTDSAWAKSVKTTSDTGVDVRWGMFGVNAKLNTSDATQTGGSDLMTVTITPSDPEAVGLMAVGVARPAWPQSSKCVRIGSGEQLSYDAPPNSKSSKPWLPKQPPCRAYNDLQADLGLDNCPSA